LRILVVHNFYQQFGGEDLVAMQEKERLEKTDDVYFYSRHNNEIRDFGMVKKARFLLDTIHSRTTSAQLTNIVKNFRPDFAYVHNIYPLISPSLYHTLHKQRIPILQVVHDFRPLCANGWFYTQQKICDACKHGNNFHAIRKKCYKDSYILSGLYAAAMTYCRWGALAKVDAFLCLTDFMRDTLADAGVPASKLFVRPNSIDASQIHTAIGQGNYVAYIGRLSPEKGLWTLIKAFEQLRDIKLKIAGTGQMEYALRSFVREKKLDNVEIVGFVAGNEKSEFLQKSRFIVLPSEWYETFGMVVLEANAVGKPAVASNLGAIPTLVEDGKSGLLFAPGDPADLARQVQFLWSAPQLVAQMGKYARALVETKYSPNAVYKQLIDIAQQMSRV